MSYVLIGRALSKTAAASDGDDTPCIFCGKMVHHFNEDGGVAFYAGSVETGTVEHYAYCISPACEEYVKDANTVQSLWHCTCGQGEDACYVDVIGAKCHECGRTRPVKSS